MSSVAVKPMAIGDHHSVDCVLMPLRPSALPTRVQVRNFKRVELDQFQRGVGRQCAELAQSEDKRLSELSEAYTTTTARRCWTSMHLSRLVRKSQPKPWYNDDVDRMRDKRRHFEHLWRLAKLEIHRQLYVNAPNAVTSCIAQAKIQFYRDNLEKAENKSMFRLVRSLGGQQKVIYPEFSSQTEGCNQFSAYFAEKVHEIRESLDTLQCDGSHQEETVCYDRPLPWHRLGQHLMKDVGKILAKTMKTCNLDPLPSTLLKGCHESLVLLFTKLTNMSLAEAEMPTCLKEALVRPLI